MARDPEQLSRILQSLVRLRRAEEIAPAEIQHELSAAREPLEELIGPTIRPADAARVLGVSPPGLLRWLDRGEIATVLTPAGRREIPLPELVGLLEGVEAARLAGSQRPIAHVIRERNRRSVESVDLDRLLPRRRARGHRVPERQALAYHRLVAERLTPSLVSEARRRVRRWEDSAQIDPRWADEWHRLLEKPITEIAAEIGSGSPHAAQLRQTSPFAGLLTTQERRKLTEGVESRD
jgi:hypothetical protein